MVLALIVGYLLLLLGIAFFTTEGNTKGMQKTNVDFFIGGRRSSWWMVSLGMVGASISGVTFVSVPGWVTSTHFSYLQMAIGFIVGYVIVAFFLLPRYYQAKEISIYAILEKKLGKQGRETAAVCFLLNKVVTSAVKLYVVIVVLHRMVFSPLGVPFYCVALLSLLIVWLYTFKGGIKTIVWTDFMQTILLLVALVFLLHTALKSLQLDLPSAMRLVYNSPLSETFVWSWDSKQHFLKQFLSGIFIVLVMTGMDQDLMQKNLSCKSLKESQRNMLSYGVLFVPVNLLFLSLGLLIVQFFVQNGFLSTSNGIDFFQTDAVASVDLGGNASIFGDQMLPAFVQLSGKFALSCFSLGMLASSFSSVDSAITSITTSLSVDFGRGIKGRKQRIVLHSLVTLLFFSLMLLLQYSTNTHAVDLIYTIVSFLYGPVLGLFSFAFFCNVEKNVRFIPLVAIFSVLFSYFLKILLFEKYGYSMGYELLLLNGILMFGGLLVSKVCSR